MIEDYTNRAHRHWPAVLIVKGIPDHPEGAVRYPRPELADRWVRMGVARMAPEYDRKTAANALPREAAPAATEQPAAEAEASVKRKRGRPRKKAE